MKSKLLLYFLMLPALFLFSYAQDPSFYMTPTCDGAVATITGDTGGTFNFNPTPADGVVIDPITGAVTGGTPGETYCVEYTLSGSITVSSIECFTVLPTADASFFMTSDCMGGAFATITGDTGGTFAFNPILADGVAINSDTGTITGMIPGTTYSIEYTIGGVCGNSSIEDVTTDCSDDYGIIEVNAFLDENSNGVFDSSEVNFGGGEFSYELNNDGIVNYVSAPIGSFIIPVFEAGDTFDIGFIIFDEYNICLNQTLILFEDITAPIGETFQVDFPLEIITNCSDIAVYLTSNVSPRPGVLNNNTLTISNLGTVAVSGSVEYTNDSFVTLEGVYDIDTGNSVTYTTTGFILNFNDLLPSDSENVTVRLDVPTSAMAGDIVTNSVVYNVSDLNIENNESILTQTVVNSYDPNDKMESHGPEIVFGDFTSNDYLYYTIRFQNLGTAEAIDIRIEDVLDSQLDVSTFKMLHASHDYILTRTDNNLIWQFDDIDLPSESMDEPNSHGYVYFKIKPTPGYALDDIIPNFADIYFDFNPAVTTNTFETTFVNSLSISEFNSTQFSIYPNPADNILTVRMSNNASDNISVAIYNVQGKLISNKSYQTETSNFQINVSDLANGLYFIKFYNDEFQNIEKLIIN